MKKILDFTIDDLGIENSSYFQGYGVAYTPYNNCAIGIGDNPAEALDDCLENMASSEEGIDFDDFERRIHADYPDFATHGHRPSVSHNYPDSEDTYYYIGIKYTL